MFEYRYPHKEVLDKIEIASRRLQDTICGYFFGQHPVTTIDNARAVIELTRGLHKHYTGLRLIPHFEQASNNKSPNTFITEATDRIINKSNFSKHSNREPVGKLEYSEDDAKIALNTACIDFYNLIGALAEHDLLDIIGDEDMLEMFDTPTKLEYLIGLTMTYLRPEEGIAQRTKDQICGMIFTHGLHIQRERSSFSLILPIPEDQKATEQEPFNNLPLPDHG